MHEKVVAISYEGGKLLIKETVLLRRWEYYKVIWFYQLG